jgi:hypothetical protein
MTIDPTRKEWQAAYERVRIAYLNRSEAHGLTAAALAPCPPEPAPKDWYAGNLCLSAVKVGRRRSVVIYCDDPQREDPYLLTSDEAVAMAYALIEHAAYAREQDDDPWRSDEEAAALIDAISPVCGRVLSGPLGERVSVMGPEGSVCQRPKGHDGACASEDRTAPKVAPQPL